MNAQQISKRAADHLHYIAAVFFSLYVLVTLWASIIRPLTYGIIPNGFAGVMAVVLIAANVIIVLPLIQSAPRYFLSIGFGLRLLHQFIYSFSYFSSGMMITDAYWDEHISFFSVIILIMILAAHLIMALIVAANTLDNFSHFKVVFNRVWFVPAVLFAAAAVLTVIAYVIVEWIVGDTWYGQYVFRFHRLLFWNAIPYGLTAAWLADAVSESATLSKKDPFSADSAPSVEPFHADALSFDLFLHTLLLFITFGVWYYIWIYRTTKTLNCVEGEEYRNPVTKLLLCIFIPFYAVYWMYKSAQRVDRLAAQKGLQSELSTLCLITALFLWPVPPILLQEKLNAISGGGAEPTPAADPIEEIKRFKELLDLGILTQEEFDKKKQELLHL